MSNSEYNRHPRPVIGAFLIFQGKYLFAKSTKHKKKWTIPGGHIEHGETLEAALRREVLEETGLTIAQFRLLDVEDSVASDEHAGIHFIFIDYLCTVENDKNPTSPPQPKLNEEFSEFKWLHKDDALKLDLIQTVKDFIAKLPSEF